MTIDNGTEVFAKLLNPNAGPHFYTVALETATRELLNSILYLLIPRVYTFSLDWRNPVGAEYIIEERAPGKPLGSLWYHWRTEDQLDLVAQVVEFQKRLTSVIFRRHRCVYFKEDLHRQGLPAHPIEAEIRRSTSLSEPLNPDILMKFAFGPLTEARLLEGERQRMDLDRGPWSSPLSYMVAMAINEVQWAKVHVMPRINLYRSMEHLEAPDHYISLLQRYLSLIPHISLDPCWTTLAHPDLHLDNIFVDPETKKISCFIDWQSTSIAEPFFHQIPRMLLPNRSQISANSLDSMSQGSCGVEVGPLRHYQELSATKNQQYWTAFDICNRELLTEPVSLVTGAWSRDDVFSFRHSLLHLAARWNKILPNRPLPISFTDEELRLHDSELQLVEDVGKILGQLHDDGVIPLGGMVLGEKYEKALYANNTVRQMFVDLAESESQKALHSRIWPYQEV